MIETLVDNITNRTVEDKIEQLHILFKYGRRHITNFFLACPDALVASFEEYIKKKFEIDKTYYTCLSVTDRYYPEITAGLKSIAPSLAHKGLLLATGFEKVMSDLQKRSLPTYRVAHDYTQDPYENRELKRLLTDKQIIIVTHIGLSEGVTAFEAGVASSLNNARFIDCVLEIKQ